MDTPSSLAHIAKPAIPAEVLRLARGKHRIVCFTGAGMSQESGLAVYRNDATGLWENVNPEELSSIAGWRKDPAPMWAFSLWRARLALNAQPNAGHKAIVRWANHPDTTLDVITQNIDNLHERAGTSQPIHLHGSLFTFRCSNCGLPAASPDFPNVAMTRCDPPLCTACAGTIRPDVVWFGEPLPKVAWDNAEKLLLDADLVVIVGTSGVVMPAAQLPLLAAECGATLLEITPAPTAYQHIVDYSWETTAAVGLPLLVEALEGD